MADPVLRSSKTPHFFQPLLPSFESHLNIPVAFSSEYLQGNRNELKTAILRSDASDKAWEVKIEAGRRLSRGWKEFTTAHDFRIGDIIIFRHEGDLVFHVTPLGPSCCEIEYTSSRNIYNIDDDSDDHQENIEPRSRNKRAKKNSRREEDSSPDNSCFVATVSVYNLSNDRLYVPVSFVRSNGLSKYGKIVLLNEMGRSWKLSLEHGKSGDKTYLRHGWRSFCNANGMNQGRYIFKLVQDSGTPVLRLCQAESSSDRSYFVGSLTPATLRYDMLYLPMRFVRSSGLKEVCCDEIALKNAYGGTWNLLLKHRKSNNRTVITRGWRSFCQANGFKAGDTFRFKLVRTGPKPVLYLCSADFLSIDPSSGEESIETEESEEENTKDNGRCNIIDKEEKGIKDKSSLRKCSSIKKWKSCSSPGASSSSSQNRFVTLTVTPYSFRTGKLSLPLRFTRVNGINKPGKITLLGQDGLKRMVKLGKDNTKGTMRLGRDWKGFCELHGVRIGESFVLELIRKKDAGPVLKFCTKSNYV